MFDNRIHIQRAGLLAATTALALLIIVPREAKLHAQSNQDPGPPPTRTDDVKDDYHGVEVADPYRWLEEQQSPETRAWKEERLRPAACASSSLREGAEGLYRLRKNA